LDLNEIFLVCILFCVGNKSEIFLLEFIALISVCIVVAVAGPIFVLGEFPSVQFTVWLFTVLRPGPVSVQLSRARVHSPETLPNRAAAFVSLGLAPSRISRRRQNFRFPSPASALPAALLIFLAPPPSGLGFPQPALGFRAAFVPCSSTRTRRQQSPPAGIRSSA
jgi:hypothetical protein